MAVYTAHRGRVTRKQRSANAKLAIRESVSEREGRGTEGGDEELEESDEGL